MDSKKTFIIINQTAGSPYHGMVYRNYYIAREWVKQGHKAIIISGSYFHNFSKLPQTNGLFTKEEIDGIEYWWVKIPRYGESKSVGRLFTLFLFPFLLLLFPFWRLARPETVIVSGPPHLSIFNAWIWSRFWGATLVYEVRDIWPLTIVKLGGVSPWHPVILLLTFFERLAYMAADRVVSVLALAYRHFEEKGMIPSKFVYIPNGVDTSSEELIDGDTARRIAEIAKRKKVIIYTGSFGIANNLDQLIEAAQILNHNQSLHFVLVGDGPHRKNLEQKAASISNVTIFASVPKKEIPGILQHAHVTYVGLMKSSLFKHGVSPNKLFDYMAAKKPVIMAIDTEDDIVGKAQCGILVPSCSSQDISEAILEITAKSDEQLSEMGMNGRKYLDLNHTYKSLAEKYLKVSKEGKRPVEESARWIASPFWIGFWIVQFVGFLAHIVLPEMAPHLFKNGISIFLREPEYYHELAEQMATLPWASFILHPGGQLSAGILAFFYKLTGVHRAFIVLPVLGILTGLTIRGIASCLDVLGVRGRWWPLIIGIIFTVTPTSLSWMIYLYEDSFIVPGVIFLSWAFMAVTLRRIRIRHFVALLLGSFFVFSNNPSLAPMFFIGALLSLPVAWKQPASQLGIYGRMIFFGLGLLIFGIVGSTQSDFTDLNTSNTQLIQFETKPQENFISRVIGNLGASRERFLKAYSDASTNFLPEIHTETIPDTLSFTPLALQLSLLEPLPLREIEGNSTKKLLYVLVQFEMALVYLSLIFLVFAGKKSWNPAVIICLSLALPMLIVLGMAIPNIGLINRYRFPFLILIKIAGLAALWNSDRFKWPGKLLFWVDPPEIPRKKKKVLFLVPDDATFLIQRLVMAKGVLNAGYEVHVACEDMGHSQKIKDLGFIFHSLDLNRGGLNPFADFFPFIRLVLFLAKERPDILQCVSIKPVIYGATAGTIVGLKRIVCLVNGLGYAFEGSNAKGKVVKLVAKGLYKNAFALNGTRAIFQNPDDLAFFVDHHLIDASKTILIRGSGVDMEKFKPTPPPQNPRPVILFVGRLLWNKGIRELVEAARILKNEKLDFTLKIVGGPDDRNPEAVPKSYLEELNKEEIIDWVGRQTDMPKFYREADVIALPTQYKEGLPLTLLEAASMARPLIATDVPGCREIVRSGVNGFLVAPKSVEELADALRKLILSAELRKKFGETSALIVREEFSAEIIQRQLVGVYESLLDDAPQAFLTPVTSR